MKLLVIICHRQSSECYQKEEIVADATINGANYEHRRNGYSQIEIGNSARYNGAWFTYQDFGNYNYGVAAKALGLPLSLVLKAAGLNEVKKYFNPKEHGNIDITNFKGFFDSSRATEMIIKGYNHF